MSPKQQTLNAPITFQGKGLHTGLHVTMTVNPAEAGHGISYLVDKPAYLAALSEFLQAIGLGPLLSVSKKYF